MNFLTIDQAAQAAGVSRDTIRRRLRDGQLPNATRAPNTNRRDPAWLIPVTDLTDAGLHPTRRTTRPPGTSPTTRHSGDTDQNTLHELTVALAATQALADARADHIADLRTQLTRAHQTITTLTTPPPAPDLNGQHHP